MARDRPTPAIVRGYQEADSDVEVRSTPYDSVSFVRGYGNQGYRLQVVECDCPDCGFDRMFREWRVQPEMADEMRYWCLNPNCGYYVGEAFAYACEGYRRSADRPVIHE